MNIEDLANLSHADWRAIEIANDTIYGLAAGGIWVSCFDEGDMSQTFGGYRQSGNARDACVESLLSYAQAKSARVRPS